MITERTEVYSARITATRKLIEGKLATEYKNNIDEDKQAI